MNIFDIIGPVMVGPSSSHTAGACRIGYAARQLLGSAPVSAEIYLHGSFADTGKGHGTDKAIVAGILGMKADDERIPKSFAAADEAGLKFKIENIRLSDAHPNSALIKLQDENGKSVEMVGASVGGGRIEIHELFGMKLRFTAEYPTIVVQNMDNPGIVARVSAICAEENVNIASFQLSRDARGQKAVMVIECDEEVGSAALEKIRSCPDVLNAILVEKCF